MGLGNRVCTHVDRPVIITAESSCGFYQQLQDEDKIFKIQTADESRFC